MQDESTHGQDNSSGGAGQPSGSKGATTSKQGQKITLTQEELTKKISDAKAEEGRKWKPIETERDQLKTQVSDLTSRLEDVEGSLRTQAYQTAKDSPETLKAWEADQALAKRERTVKDRENAVSQRETQVKTDEEAISGDKGTILIPKIAAKHKINSSELEGLGITDEETLDKVAAKIAARTAAGGEGEGEGEGEGKGEGEGEGTFEPAGAASSKGVKTGKATESVEAAEKASMEAITADVAPELKQ